MGRGTGARLRIWASEVSFKMLPTPRPQDASASRGRLSSAGYKGSSPIFARRLSRQPLRHGWRFLLGSGVLLIPRAQRTSARRAGRLLGSIEAKGRELVVVRAFVQRTWNT